MANSADMWGRCVLVTGSTDGIGKETAAQLLDLGAKVILHGRSDVKLQTVSHELERRCGRGPAGMYTADFSSLHAVRSFTEELRKQHPDLHVLLNNAGVYMRERVLSADGYEMTFAVNHLATMLLTLDLLPLLHEAEKARIVTVSSVAHTRGSIDFSNLQGERRFDGYAAYATSKLANVLFSLQLAKEARSAGIGVHALHPGVITTKLLYAGFGMEGDTVEAGARTSVHAATAAALEGRTGMYFSDSREARVSRTACDTALQQRFWKHSMELLDAAVGMPGT